MHPNWTDQINGREKEFEQVRDAGFHLSVNVSESDINRSDAAFHEEENDNHTRILTVQR
jgi:hypothetical protein